MAESQRPTPPTELKQFVSEIISSSSQYGDEIAYTVSNLVGPCNCYPIYGDYTDLCVLRTYGPWWRRAPSAPRSIPRTSSLKLDDYIEIGFEKAVYPRAIVIYETYNPGAVVRISCARSGDPRRNTASSPWFTLWKLSGALQSVEHQAQAFSPPLRSCPFPTRSIRLELCHELLHYYTELDAVELIGSESPPLPAQPAAFSLPLSFAKLTVSDVVACSSSTGPFDMLSDDMLRMIVGYLDMHSLCAASRVNRRFRDFCADPLLRLHLELDLQLLWNIVTDRALTALSRRCTKVRALSMSWCGSHNMVGQAAFVSFLNSCGASLSCLRLACCPFVDDSVLHNVVHCCPYLTELDVSSCSGITAGGFKCLEALYKLERINFYRTFVDTPSMVAIVRKCTKLEHINLGACTAVNNFDAVVIEISHHCTGLKSADFWRARGLTDVGVSALAERCTNLLELDIGWCDDIQCTTGIIVRLSQHCVRLVKLFLTAIRTVSDRELNALGTNCAQLEQLDVLGTSLVTQQGVNDLLQRCSKLCFLDLSFCSGIDVRHVHEWSDKYKQCSIKNSYQCSERTGGQFGSY